MGEAKRRKEKGLYPEQTPKPETKARTKVLSFGYGDGSAIALALTLASIADGIRKNVD